MRRRMTTMTSATSCTRWWIDQSVNPEAYVELLKVGYTSAKSADPDVVIICGALAANIDLGPRDMNDFLFLQRMYDAGAADYFDILAMQGYGLWSGPTDRRMQPRVVNYSRPRFEAVEPRYGRVSLQQQARYAILAYERAKTEWPWLGVINFWYFKRADDAWLRNGQPEAYFQMATPDFEPLPVYHAMQEYISQGQ